MSSLCPNCRKEVSSGDKFCNDCGHSLERKSPPVKCPGCGREITADKFCPECGYSLRKEAKPVLEDNVWRSKPDQFAARVGLGDLERKGMMANKELTVAPGTMAVILEDGKSVGVVDPGTYPMEDFLKRLAGFFGMEGKERSAILYKDGDLGLDFAIGGLPTQDSLDIDVKVAIDVRIDNAALFAASLMGRNDVFTLAELRSALFRPLQLTLRQSIRQCGVDELRDDFSLQNRFDRALETAMKDFLAPFGLVFGRVGAFDFVHKRYDDLRRSKGEHYVEKLEQELALEGEKGELAISLERFEAITKAKRALDRADVLSQDEMKHVEAELKKVGLEREAALRVFTAEQNQKAGVEEAKSKHALEMLGIVQDQELAKIQTLAARRDELALSDHKAELAKKSDEIRWRRELEEVRHHAERRQIERDTERKDRDEDRDQTLKDARAQAEIDGIQLDGDKEAQKAKLEYRKETQKTNLEYLKGLAEIDAETSRAKAQAKADRIRAFAGMDTEQILAINRDGGAAAEALKAKYAAQGSEAQLQERLRSEEERRHELMNQQQQFMDMLNKTHLNSMQQMKEVAVGQAQKPNEFKDMHQQSVRHLSEIAVAQAKAGGSGSGAGPATRCAHCSSTDNAPGARFCRNCGNAV